MKGRAVTLDRTLLLARQEVWRCRKSYLLMAAIALCCGLAAAVLSAATFGTDGSGGGSASAFLLDSVFVLALAIVARFGVWLSKTDSTYHGHLPFLRCLPLGVPEIVAGRTLTVLLSATVLSVPLLTLPYALSGSFRAQFSPPEYLFFAALWFGYVLVVESIGLFTEWAVGGQAGFWLYTALLFPLGLAVGYSSGWETSLVVEAIELGQRYGPLPGLSVLLFGVLLLTFSAWATTWRLRKKDLRP